MSSDPETRLRELGLELPAVPEAAGAYVPATRTANLVFTAGQLPFENGELRMTLGPEDAGDTQKLIAAYLSG